jgi:hypothetical protein
VKCFHAQDSKCDTFFSEGIANALCRALTLRTAVMAFLGFRMYLAPRRCVLEAKK